MTPDLKRFIHKPSNSFWRKIPVTGYLGVFVIGTAFLMGQLHPEKSLSNDNWDFLYGLLRKFIWVAVALLLLFSFLSVFFSWLAWKKQKTLGDFFLQLDNKEDNTLTLQLRAPMRPIGGLMKLRFLGKNDYASNLVLLEPIAHTKNDKGLTTFQLRTHFPHIEEYDLEKIVFYFYDFFHFFRFPMSLDKKFVIVENPIEKASDNIQIRPQKTQDETEKTYSNRKMHGDLLHFKQYESNDDIRRIVWQLYAKTGELVVRQPEIQNQYASDAIIFASFFSTLPIDNKSAISQKMLDFYKNAVYSSFKKLKEEGEFDIYLTTDQNSKSLLKSNNEVQRHLANCEWQQQQSLKNAPQKETISLLIVSSLDNADEVAEWMQNIAAHTEILFVPLSDAFIQPSKKEWMRWIFTNSDQNQPIKDRIQWWTSPLRSQIVANENRLRNIISSQKSSLLAS